MSRYFPPLLPDDPRITAYALGELDAEESAFVEKALAKDPDLAGRLDETREATRLLADALELEDAPARTPSAAQAPSPEPAGTPQTAPNAAPESPRRKKPSILRFPQLYFVIGGMAAAGFSVLVALRPEPKPRPQAKTPARTLVEGGWSAKESEADATTQERGETAVAESAAPSTERSLSLSRRRAVPLSAELRREPRRNASAQVYFAALSQDASPRLRLDGLGEAEPFVRARAQPSINLELQTKPENFERLRNELLSGNLPKPAEVDIGALLSSYSFAPPAASLLGFDAKPISFATEVAPAPWDQRHRLAKIDVRTREASDGKTVGGLLAKNPLAAIDFNTEAVAAYRVIGYETAQGQDPEAADLTVNHRVTYLVELTPTAANDAGTSAAQTEGRNQVAVRAVVEKNRPLFTFRLSWVDPQSDARLSESHVVSDPGLDWDRSSSDFKFAASLGAFGMLLRQTPKLGTTNFPDVERWAEQGLGSGNAEERRGFIDLVKRAEELSR